MYLRIGTAPQLSMQSQAHLSFVEEQVGEVGLGHLLRMALMLAGAVVEGIDGIMERGGRERLGCAYFKAFAGMVELTPVADVGLVAGSCGRM